MACMTGGSLLEIVVGGPALLEARHPFLLFRREIRRLQEIPPPLPRPPYGHYLLPPLDPRVIPRPQDLRHHLPLEHLGARVLRVLEESAGERVPRRSCRVAQDSRPEPYHCLRHRDGRHLAAGEDVVADGELLVDQALAHALVHSFVASAQQDELALSRELAGHGLGEAPPRRIEEDDTRARRPQRLET